MAENDDDTAALAALRSQIDAVDDGLQDLLIRRAGLVAEVGRVKRRDDVAFFRPGREAQVLRRLIGRHSGRFPRASLVRIWREIMSSAVVLQGGLSVAVCADCWDLARDHFGSQTPLLAVPTAEEATLAVAEGRAALGVLPFPEDDDSAPWWLALGAAAEPRLHVVARLPFGALGNAAGNCADAFVIAAMEPEPSGDDCTLLAIESGAKRTVDLTAAFLAARIDANPIACAPIGDAMAHLVEIETVLDAADRRIAQVLKALGEGSRVTWLGLYARPLPDAVLGGVAPE